MGGGGGNETNNKNVEGKLVNSNAKRVTRFLFLFFLVFVPFLFFASNRQTTDGVARALTVKYASHSSMLTTLVSISA